MRAKSFALDALIAALLAALLAAAGVYLSRLTGGLVPDHNTYFGADTDRVVANLLDPNSNFGRSTVHPLVGAVCIAFRRLAYMHLPPRTAFDELAAANGALFAVMLYGVVRCWNGARGIAAASVVLAASSASFVYWAGMPETHFLAGLTVLAIFMLVSLTPREPVLRMLHGGVCFALGCSLVLTNFVAWWLAEVDFGELLARRPATFIADNARRIPAWIAAGLAGLGILTIGAAAIDLLMPNPSQGRLLHVFGEAKFVTLGVASPLGSLNALGLAGPNVPLAGLFDLVLVALVLWAAWRLRGRALFIALFALFGVAFHTIYSRNEAFIFAPDYAPAAFAAIALALSGWRPRVAFVAIMVAALGLGYLNLQGYRQELRSVAQVSKPLEVYELQRVERAQRLALAPPPAI